MMSKMSDTLNISLRLIDRLMEQNNEYIEWAQRLDGIISRADRQAIKAGFTGHNEIAGAIYSMSETIKRLEAENNELKAKLGEH